MRRRPGFTLIEMLVVLGIIMVLAGMLFVGLRALMGSGKKAMTENILQQGKNLLVEYEVVTKAGGLTGLPMGAVAAPGLVENEEDTASHRYMHATIVTTNDVMKLLNSIPSNKAALAKMPNERFLKKLGSVTQPILLDGWSNPIIYVPSAGLTGLTLNKVANQSIQSPDGRPFWASAGEDGDFSKGDDNVYSFEKK